MPGVRVKELLGGFPDCRDDGIGRDLISFGFPSAATCEFDEGAAEAALPVPGCAPPVPGCGLMPGGRRLAWISVDGAPLGWEAAACVSEGATPCAAGAGVGCTLRPLGVALAAGLSLVDPFTADSVPVEL